MGFKVAGKIELYALNFPSQMDVSCSELFPRHLTVISYTATESEVMTDELMLIMLS